MMRKTWGILAKSAGVLALLLLALPLLLAQRPLSGEIEAQGSTDDKSSIWALEFHAKEPRIITVNIPGRGTRVCWYLLYWVANRSGEPRLLIPDFELVTLDDQPAVYHDEILPAVEDAIKKREDPSGFMRIENSVTISARPIPVSQAEDKASPRKIYGVAIWDGTAADPKQRDPKVRDLATASQFRIFVSGLSNGWVLVDAVGEGPDPRPIIRRKTLQISFKRAGDPYVFDSRQITWLPPAEWIYRKSDLNVPKGAVPMPPLGDRKEARLPPVQQSVLPLSPLDISVDTRRIPLPPIHQESTIIDSDRH
jgi:hypothetical protein